MAFTSCLSGKPRFFSGIPQLCCTSSFKVSSQQSSLVFSLGPDPLPWALAPSPHLLWWTCNLLLGWELLFGNDLYGELSSFCLSSTCCFIPFWGSEALLLAPPMKAFLRVCRNFSPFLAPSQGHRFPPQNSLSLFCPTSFCRDWLAF